MTLAEMKKRRDEIRGRLKELDGLGDEITSEQITESDELSEELRTLAENISDLEQRQQARREALAAEERMEERQVPHRQPGEGAPDEQAARAERSLRVTGERSDDDRMCGYRDAGEFLVSVGRAARSNHRNVDPRLDQANQRAATTYGSEGVGEDGGYAAPPMISSMIMKKVFEDLSLLSMVDAMETPSNAVEFPVDEQAAWGSTGVYSEWEGEGDVYAEKKPKLKNRTLRLNKLVTLVKVTDELLEDAQGLQAWLRKKAAAAINAKINTAIIAGTGAGQPLGIINAPATVSVAKVGSQVADTIVGLNIVNMWARLTPEAQTRCRWLINPDTLPQLMTLMKQGRLDTGATDTGWGVPLYVPPNGLADAPHGTLLGRPIVPVQACKTLGDLGDIIAADLGEYFAPIKAGGIREDVSIHLDFDQSITAFRFIMRIAGQPWLSAAITPENGSNTLSSFVTLAARA